MYGLLFALYLITLCVRLFPYYLRYHSFLESSHGNMEGINHAQLPRINTSSDQHFLGYLYSLGYAMLSFMYISRPTHLSLKRQAESTLFLTSHLFTTKSDSYEPGGRYGWTPRLPHFLALY